jgi:tRNA-uridine aminocarboxypropyltransferase
MTAFVTRCARCRQQRCVCGEIPRVVTRTRFVIVRHRGERARASNTGHFAALAVDGCELFEYGGRGARFDETRLRVGEGTFLLFPGGGASLPERAPARVIVLDGSWPQARHMRQRILALRGVPLLTLPAPDPTRHRLRRQVHDYGMTTLEAIARTVALFEGAERAAPLERLHDAIVRGA